MFLLFFTGKADFSIPDKISNDLDQAIPSKKRSKFITACQSKRPLDKNRRKEFDCVLGQYQPRQDVARGKIRGYFKGVKG